MGPENGKNRGEREEEDKEQSIPPRLVDYSLFGSVEGLRALRLCLDDRIT